MKELNIDNTWVQQDIKKEKITLYQIEEMEQLSGSYESLFSRRAMKYKSMGLKEKALTEKDYKDLILGEYTFLSRPVFIIESTIFIGNSKKVIESVKKAINA